MRFLPVFGNLTPSLWKFTNMKNVLIIKTGDTFAEIKASDGDFEDMFSTNLTGIEVDITVYDARELQPLPDITPYDRVIITGSHSMVTDCEPWSERMLPYIKLLREMAVPTLGICYGLQLMAKAFGGTVGLHVDGPQAGSNLITLTKAGKQDKLLGYCPSTLMVNAGNSQRVLKVPAGAVVLAGNDFEPHQAIRFGKVMWGLQFHPEFNRQITSAYIDRTTESLQKYGRSAEAIKEACIDTNDSREILRNFISLKLS